MPNGAVSNRRARPVRRIPVSTLRSVAHSGVRAGRMIVKAYQKYKKHVKKTQKPVKVHEKEQDSHSGISSNIIKIKGKAPVKLNKRQTVMGQWRYSQNHSGLMTSAQGQQKITTVCYVNTLAQAILSAGNSFAIFQNNVALSALNPAATNTGSSRLGSVIQPLEDRFVVRNVSIDLEMTNFQPVGVYADIFVCKFKKWSNDGANVNAIIDKGFANEAFGQGVATSTLTGTAVSVDPGVQPQMSKLFSEYYTVCAVKSLEMTAGSTQKTSIEIGLNTLVKVDYWREQLATAGFHPQSYVIFVRTRGSLTYDGTLGAAGVSYGPTQLGYVAVVKYSCHGVAGGNDNRLSTNIYSLNNIPTASTNANQHILNEVDMSSGPVIVT